ncbi:MAG TPA: hypothetical protein VNY84_12440, partial [Acidimicrobiales bacterium]|nr:hypothetical protein [Acidimicrobiales bacterium]
MTKDRSATIRRGPRALGLRAMAIAVASSTLAVMGMTVLTTQPAGAASSPGVDAAKSSVSSSVTSMASSGSAASSTSSASGGSGTSGAAPSVAIDGDPIPGVDVKLAKVAAAADTDPIPGVDVKLGKASVAVTNGTTGIAINENGVKVTAADIIVTIDCHKL